MFWEIILGKDNVFGFIVCIMRLNNLWLVGIKNVNDLNWYFKII